jgi:hypothetical protein
VEDDLVTAAGGDDLPIAAAQGTLGPPTIFNQPRLTHAVHDTTVDELRLPIVVRADGDPARHGETARTAHGVIGRLEFPGSTRSSSRPLKRGEHGPAFWNAGIRVDLEHAEGGFRPGGSPGLAYRFTQA